MFDLVLGPSPRVFAVPRRVASRRPTALPSVDHSIDAEDRIVQMKWSSAGSDSLLTLLPRAAP